MDSYRKKQLEDLTAGRVKWGCPLSSYTSFQIGGPAEAVVTVNTLAELQQVLAFAAEYDVAWRVLGRGTNILVRDSGFNGIILLLGGDFKKLDIAVAGSRVTLRSGAGRGLAGVSAMCLEKGFTGLEFATGIPGTLGGAVIMNAGAWGREMADVIEWVEVVILEQAGRGNGNCLKKITKKELQPGYRAMAFPVPSPFIVTQVGLNLDIGERVAIETTCREYTTKRKQTQPVNYGNAGSVFKNPEGDSAGRLIEECGLKGLMVGGAQVSTLHANFIINRGNARAEDVMTLMARVQESVLKKSGVLLEPEVQTL